MKMIHMQFIPLYFNAKLAKMLVFTKYPQIKKESCAVCGRSFVKKRTWKDADVKCDE